MQTAVPPLILSTFAYDGNAAKDAILAVGRRSQREKNRMLDLNVHADWILLQFTHSDTNLNREHDQGKRYISLCTLVTGVEYTHRHYIRRN